MNNLYDVFISYRRSDGLTIAEALYKYLTSKGLRVFFDKHEMIDGHYFTTQIESNLKIAPNYILIATDDVFKFREGEDWVRKEIEVAINEYESNPTERTINVICMATATFPEKEALPESVRNIADPQRILLPYGEGFAEPFKKVLESVTAINRRNLWFAAHRWLENSKQPGGRFASLNINESILPTASETTKEHKEMPINVYTKGENNDAGLPLLEAMGQSTDHLYLIGQGGIGKTTALMHKMNSDYANKTYSENAKIPIFVELSFAPDTYGALYEGGKSSFIRRSIYKQIREDRTIKQVTAKEVRDIDEVFTTISYDVAVNPINNILSKTSPAPEYLLLLDGLNEVSSVIIEETGLSVVRMVMNEIAFLISECPNVRVVLTSRSDEELPFNNDAISRLYLSGLQEKTIKDYLESFGLSKEIIEKVLEDENLRETLQIPLFLTMYASLSKCNEASTQGEILKLFFNERRKNISVYTMQDRLAAVEKNVSDAASAVQKNRIDADMQNFILDFILPEIAWDMERKDEFYLSLRDIRKLIEPILNNTDDTSVCGDFGQELFSKYRYGASAKMHTYKVANKFFDKLDNSIKEITESIVDCCVFAMGIMQENNSKYGFVHQHIRDYFAAVKNINTIRLSVYLYEEDEKEFALECMNKTFKDEPVNLTVRRFMGEALGEHRNKPYLSDGIWYSNVPENKCDRTLIKRALDIYRNKFDGECGYGIYSLITILKEVRKDLSGEDFSYLDMKYCNLNGTILGRPFLSAKFDGALVNDYTFMYPEIKGLHESMAISPNEHILATCSINGDVFLWSLKTFSLIKKINISSPEAFIKNFLYFGFIESGKALAVAINYVNYDEAFRDMLKSEMPKETTRKEAAEVIDKIIEKNNLMRTKTIHISSDTLEVTELSELNNDIVFSQSTGIYKASEPQTFRIPEGVNFSEYKNLSDLKNEKSGEGVYSEHISPDGKFSLCQFYDRLTLYDLQTGNLINSFQNCNWYFDEINVLFIDSGILIISDSGTSILFDYNLKFLQKKELSAPVNSVALSQNYLVLYDCVQEKTTILNAYTFDILGVIDNSRPHFRSVYFCQDKNTAFFSTTEDKAFVYDLNKKQVIDFVEAVYYSSTIPLFLSKSIGSYYLNNELQTEYADFSKKSPTELKSVIGFDYLRQKEQPVYQETKKINDHTVNIHSLDYSNGLWLLKEEYPYPENKLNLLCCNEKKDRLATIIYTGSHFQKAIFTNDNKKIVLLDQYRNRLCYIDTKEVIDKKKIDINEFKSITITHFILSPISSGFCKAPDDNSVSVITEDKMYFYNIEKEECYKQIEHTGGLYVIGVELNDLHPKSELSEDTKQKLKQYGAKI